ncbi:hypothetical protein QJQ45_025951 [Haematococcus lacustris]|nr:hypothetical protein QJQ45_025951 [Haematococcus lacustris]
MFGRLARCYAFSSRPLSTCSRALRQPSIKTCSRVQRTAWAAPCSRACSCSASHHQSSPPPPPQSCPPVDRAAYNAAQAAAFSSPSTVAALAAPLPEVVEARLRRIAESVPDLGCGCRVVDVGSGTGVLIPHLQARGVKDILAVDLSDAMLHELRRMHAPAGSHLGNDLGVQVWRGDILDLPNYLGWAADAFFFNGMFGNMLDPRAALVKALLLVKPGGHLVVSHPLGRAWQAELAAQQPHLTPHTLPSQQELEHMLQGLPLTLTHFEDLDGLYLAVMQVPPRYAFPAAPLHLAAPVVAGFGRGSKQLGTATANMDPGALEEQLRGLAPGVYYGWARLLPGEAGGSWSAEDTSVHKMVMNVGCRPTVNAGGEALSVEVHVMHPYTRDFYGQELRVVVLGFIRPELKFQGGLPELMDRIQLDKAIARNQLDDPASHAHAQDPFLGVV